MLKYPKSSRAHLTRLSTFTMGFHCTRTSLMLLIIMDFEVSPSPLTALTRSVFSLSLTLLFFFFLSTLDGLIGGCSFNCLLLRGSDLCLVGLWLRALNQSRVVCLFRRVTLALSIALLLVMFD